VAKHLLNTTIKNQRRHFDLIATYWAEPLPGAVRGEKNIQVITEKSGTLEQCVKEQETLHKKHWPQPVTV
jgi:hypothetical protein